MPVSMARKGTSPCGAQLSLEQESFRRGEGKEKQLDQEKFQSNPHKDLGALLCFLHSSALWDELPSLPVLSLSPSGSASCSTGYNPQGLLSVILRTVSYLEEERGFVWPILPWEKFCFLQKFVSSEGFAGFWCLAEQQVLLAPTPGAGEVSLMP